MSLPISVGDYAPATILCNLTAFLAGTFGGFIPFYWQSKKTDFI